MPLHIMNKNGLNYFKTGNSRSGICIVQPTEAHLVWNPKSAIDTRSDWINSCLICKQQELNNWFIFIVELRFYRKENGRRHFWCKLYGPLWSPHVGVCWYEAVGSWKVCVWQIANYLLTCGQVFFTLLKLCKTRHSWYGKTNYEINTLLRRL